jgi:hypothetical protein
MGTTYNLRSKPYFDLVPLPAATIINSVAR